MSIRVGLVGTNGAGKSTACEWFVAQGFSCISLSDYVRSAATEQNLGHDRLTLIEVANRLKKEQGNDVLATKAMESSQHIERVVFDSIRHPIEMNTLKKHATFIIGIDAPVELRYQRIQQRQKETDKVTFTEFQHHDELERFGASSGQSIQSCIDACDHVVMNTHSMETLWDELHTYSQAHNLDWTGAN